MSAPSPPPLRIGLVGYGGFGRFLHRTWGAAEGVSVVAVASLDGGPPDLPVLSNWAALLDRDDVDLVAIATPPSTHADIAVAALDAGKHVIVEKPVALSVDDADRLIAARDRSGRVAAVDFMLRFNPIVEALVDWTRRGVFGHLSRVAVENEAQSESLGADHWFWDPAQSGGILVEHAVHFLDLVNACVGRPAARVDGWARRRDDGRTDRVLAVVEHDVGPLATHYHAFTRPTAFERSTMRFTFEQAEVEVEGWVPMGGRVRTPGQPGESQAEALRALPGYRPSERPPGCAGLGEGGDDAWATFALGTPKSAAYAGALRALLDDVRHATVDPTHQVRATLEAGREALRQACLATERASERAGRDTSGSVEGS